MGKIQKTPINVEVPNNYNTHQYNGFIGWHEVSSVQYLWGYASWYPSAIPSNPDANADSGQGILVGQGLVYNAKLPPSLRTRFWRFRGYCAFDTSFVGDLISSGYLFTSCLLNIIPSYVYCGNNWDLRIYCDAGRGGMLGTLKAGLNTTYYLEDSYLRSGYDYILPSDIINNIDYDDDYNDFIEIFAEEANWDWYGACYNQKILDRFDISSNFSVGNSTIVDVPLHSININGRTDYKFVSAQEDENDENGMAIPVSTYQFMDIDEDKLSLSFAFYGMRLLRLTNISIIKFIQGLFDNNAIYSSVMSSGVKDEYPEDPEELILPSVVVIHTSTDKTGVELTENTTYYDRFFGIEIFGTNHGMVADMEEIIASGLYSVEKIPIYDYNQGFDLSANDLPIIAYLENIDYEVYPVDMYEQHPKLKYRMALFVKTKTKFVNPNFDKFYINISPMKWVEMMGGG